MDIKNADITTRLSINPITRTISPKYRTSKGVYVAKGDHNSVLIVFEVPKIVDGHDMSSDIIHIHYANMDEEDKTKYSKGVSEVAEAYKYEEEETGMLVFGWLIPNTATRYAGVVSIGVTFERYENDGEEVHEVFSWSTAPYGKTIVWDSMDNDAEAVDRDFDYLVKTCNAIVEEAIKREIDEEVQKALEEAIASGELKGDPFTYEDFTPEQLEALKGKDGTVSFDELTEEQKESLKGEPGETPDLSDYVKNTDYAELNGKAGIVYLSGTSYGLYFKEIDGISRLSVYGATEDVIKKKGSAYQPITPKNLDFAVKIALADNKFTLEDAEKTAIANWLGTSQVEIVSYEGTGTCADGYGDIGGECSVTFSFAPNLLIMLGMKNPNNDWIPLNRFVNNTIYCDVLGTTIEDSTVSACFIFEDNQGVDLFGYGWKSNEGKTVNWYVNSSALGQCNESGFTYYIMAVRGINNENN